MRVLASVQILTTFTRTSSATMGRRRFKRKTGPGANYSEIERENKAFEQYYKEQEIVPEEQWDQFIATLKTNLPATFRITGFRSHAKHLLKFLKGHYFSELLNQSIDGVPVERPQPIPWYPDELAWCFNLTRQNIRKLPALEKLHNFLVTETESGNISRQEAVSMIPPLLMDIQSHHKVLDMCAAPGSKTAQLIEMLHADLTQGWPEGFVIANDADNKRCYIMVHQAKRLNSPCCMIVNHDASYFPNIKITGSDDKPESVKYDRVLCDVPCSGDGTLRKNYVIWKKWTVNSGLHLHNLQQRILLRGVEVLEVGGRLVYSTCSFNPLENEAVIASVLKQCKGAVELVDVSNELPGLQRQPGLTTWKVTNEKLEVLPNYETIPEDKRHRIKQSMFPPSQEEAIDMHLTRCIRLLPHHQDTGGFFVAVLRKVKPLPWTKEAKKASQNDAEASNEACKVDEVNETSDEKSTEATAPAAEDEASSSTGDKITEPPSKKARYSRGFKEDPFVFFLENEQVWPQIREFYGVDPSFPCTQLLTRCYVGKKRNLYLVNQAVKQILQINEDSLKVINSGVKTWCRSDAKGVDCDFRLAQDGIHCIFPYVTCRKLSITKDDVITLLTQENPFYHKFSDDTKQQIKEMPQGSLIFIYDPKQSDQNTEDVALIICGWKGKTSVRSFVAKGDRHHILRMCGVADTAIYADKPGGSKKKENTGDNAGASTGTGASGNEKMEEGTGEAEADVALGQDDDDDVVEDEADGEGDEDGIAKENKVVCDSTADDVPTKQSMVSMATENTDKGAQCEQVPNAAGEGEKADDLEKMDSVSSTQDNASGSDARTESKQTVSCAETSEVVTKKDKS